MKILFVTEYFYPKIGGGEKWAFELCSYLAKQNHKITVITSKYNKNLPDIEFKNKIKIIRFAKSYPLPNLIGRLIYAYKLKSYLNELLKKEKYDVIHSLAYISNLPSSIIAKRYGIFSVTSIHSYLDFFWFKVTNPFLATLNYILEKIIILFDKSDVIHVPTKYMAKKLYFVSDFKKKVIYNEVNIDKKEVSKRFNKNNFDIKFSILKNELILVSIGNLQKIKNFHSLIKNISKLKRPFKLFIIGKGEEEKNLKKLIYKKKMFKKIIMVGKLNHFEVLNFIKRADIVIIPSYVESFSYVIAESLIMEKPVISTSKVGLAYDLDNIILNIPLKKLANYLENYKTFKLHHNNLKLFTGNYKLFEKLYLEKK